MTIRNIECLGNDGLIKISLRDTDGTFRIELHTDCGSMASCEFTEEHMNALVACIQFRINQPAPEAEI